MGLFDLGKTFIGINAVMLQQLFWKLTRDGMHRRDTAVDIAVDSAW